MEKKLKIAMCYLAIGEVYKLYTKESRKNKILYCEKHGYDFIDDESIHDKTRPIPWSKIPLLLKYLDNYDYLAWCDADMLIHNDSIKIEHFIEKYKDYDMFCGTDWIMPNTGFWIVKNTDFSKEYLKSMLTNVYDENEFKDGRYKNYEQGSFVSLYDKNFLNAKNKIKISDEPRECNSYWFNFFSEFDFILHLAAVRNQLLEFLIKEYFPNRLDDDTDETYNSRMKWLKSFACRKDLDDKLQFEKDQERKWVEKDRRFKEDISVDFVLSKEYDIVQQNNLHHFEMLSKLAEESTTKFNRFDPNKQTNLFSLSKNVKNILQIGLRAGHEALTFLISNQSSKIYCFDTYKYSFTKACAQYLQQHFPDRLFVYEGNSIDEIPKFNENTKISVDLVYICTKAMDISNGNFFTCIPLIHYKTFLIIDNLHMKYLWDGYVNDKTVKEIKDVPSELLVVYFIEGPEE